MRRGIVIVGLMLLSLAGASAADQWPQFRGRQAGVADDDPALPDRWSESENVAWKIDLPGQGWSSPVVWNDHVIVTTAVGEGTEPIAARGLADPTADSRVTTPSVHRWVVYDIDFKTGTIRWMRELGKSKPAIARQAKNTYASETPVTDGERIYVYVGSLGIVAALDFDGTPVWTREVGAFENRGGWGSGASPALHGDRLYIVSDNKTQAFIAALDTKTGREVWRTRREEAEGWGTPFVWAHESHVEIVTIGVRKTRSYDVDGRQLWEVAGMSTLDFGGVPTPFAKHGLVYVSAGYPGDPKRPVFAIRPGASGDISLKPDETSNQHVAWFQPTLGSYQPSSLVYGDYYYALLDRGFLLCHDARSGRQIYGRQRVAADASGFTASPWAYNGKVFALSEDGDTFVMQAGPAFKLLGRNSLNEMALATPAVARGSLFIRTQSKLYRITKGEQG
jgi:outer membrane protein assembly factor BamB